MARAAPLTLNQERILKALDPQAAPPDENHGASVQEIDSWINSHLNVWLGYDRLHSSLVRMEKRGLVKRKGRPARWSLMRKGKDALARLR